MSEENKAGQPKVSFRPDPLFKEIVRLEAIEQGLVLLESQFPQLLTADFLLYVPLGVSLVDTRFDFISPYLDFTQNVGSDLT